jgi:hypothetical protein
MPREKKNNMKNISLILAISAFSALCWAMSLQMRLSAYQESAQLCHDYRQACQYGLARDTQLIDSCTDALERISRSIPSINPVGIKK